MIGFGGAFTGTATHDLLQLSDPAAQDNLLKQYFGDGGKPIKYPFKYLTFTGIGYTMCRVRIGATDFSNCLYSYDDPPGNADDFNLTHFDISGGSCKEDITYKIPTIQKALNISQGSLRLFASPWSAPVWMKDNHNTMAGSIKGDPVVNNAYRMLRIKNPL